MLINPVSGEATVHCALFKVTSLINKQLFSLLEHSFAVRPYTILKESLEAAEFYWAVRNVYQNHLVATSRILITASGNC